MAFQRPTSYAPQPHLLVSEEAQSFQVRVEDEQSVDISQEWVLFSPSIPVVVEARTDTTENALHTTDLSPESELGLPSTGEGRYSEDEGDTDYIGSAQHEVRDEEDGLDSLDSHLLAFHEPTKQRFSHYEHNDAAVLPAHDGRGSFIRRTEEHSASLERHPLLRQIPSVLNALEAREEEEVEAGRTERIRAWRLEQSQILLERIESEVKRMKDSEIVEGVSRSGDEDKVAHSGNIKDKGAASTNVQKENSKEDEDPNTNKDTEDDSNAPFWKRITRRVIRDIIGIDEPLLSIILGESLPDIDETSTSTGDVSSAKLDTDGQDVMTSRKDWQERLLERIALELGKLVHRLSKHPGAFSTYLRTQQTPDYVGATFPTARSPSEATARSSLHAEANHQVSDDLSNGATQFLPSIPPQILHPEPKSNAIDSPLDHSSTRTPITETDRLRLEREYWERELDISMVFSFLRNRFSRRRPHPAPQSTYITSQRPSSILSSSSTTAAAAAAAARAATIRQHHPLASKLQPSPRTENSLYLHHLTSITSSLKRPGSSCGSESTKSNKKAKGKGSESGVFSRNYWDLGGSVGGSTDIATEGGGLGGWGEV
ncbi:MAG: hypothetical protein M1816_004896 [Peltula sp. TS41687]|nr:MAG: hypothetical protein M1816_004896 [Peltula sp. TS41687]